MADLVCGFPLFADKPDGRQYHDGFNESQHQKQSGKKQMPDHCKTGQTVAIESPGQTGDYPQA